MLFSFFFPFQALRSFSIVLPVDSKYHPNIIGKKGATINKIRDDHEVKIQLPDKDGPNADDITITGYEHQVSAAREDILKIVQELVSCCEGLSDCHQ
jgi:predicted PilT family ATPase